MEEKIINTRRGLYGQVHVTLPMPVKLTLMELVQKSGMKRAEFLRTALIMGTAKLSEDVFKTDHKGEVVELFQQPARTCGGRTA
jgi:hypothetical protein